MSADFIYYKLSLTLLCLYAEQHLPLQYDPENEHKSETNYPLKLTKC